MSNTIDWKKIWDKYNDWFEDLDRRQKCNTCGHTARNDPEWEDQQEKIKQLIDEQVREIVKKKV